MTGDDAPALPSFATPRLVLRQRGIADLEACLAMDRDPEVTRFIIGPWADPIAHRAFVEARIRALYPEGMGYWSVLAGDEFIGWILLTPLDLRGPEVEIGWRLFRSAWGRGYATEAAAPVLRYALETLRLPRVVADIDPGNAASLGVARKLGLRRLGPIDYAGRTVQRWVGDGPKPQ
ncbi:MAG: GNAT family N-acetyltransferase [Alphaproteobacteria bacterium]|nr:GNAT family N-acetyltransferase [Alphaproteobacteria bacterium]